MLFLCRCVLLCNYRCVESLERAESVERVDLDAAQSRA